MNEVLIIVGVVVVTMGVMASWVCLLGRIDSRAGRRRVERKHP